MRNARLDEVQTGIQISRRNVNNLRYVDDNTFMAESEELKSILMKVKEETENELTVTCFLSTLWQLRRYCTICASYQNPFFFAMNYDTVNEPYIFFLI